MIRLKVDATDRWLELAIAAGGQMEVVRVKVRPRTSIMDGAAAAHAAKKVRVEMEDAAASAEAGMPLDPDGFTAANTDVINAKFNQYQIEALAQFGIIEWEGIADDDGKPLPFSAEAAVAFVSVPPLGKAFADAYTAPAVLLAEEGNASATSSAGDTAAAGKPASDAQPGPVDPGSPDLSVPGAPQQ